MSTSLSRHLFRLDEVAASLRYALIERRIEEGMYWTEELIDSEECELLLKILVDVWIFSIGPFGRLSLLPMIANAASTINKTSSSDSLRLLSFSILRSPKSAADGSIVAIAVLAMEDLRTPSLETQMKNMNLHNTSSEPDTALANAIQQHDLHTAALYILKGATVKGLILERRTYTAAVRRLLASAASPIWHILWSIVDAAILTMTIKEFAAATVSAEPAELSASMQEKLAEWQATVGRRRRRCFKVQTIAIKWLTVRGRMTYKESTEGDLQRNDVWKLLEGCSYWNRKAAEFGLRNGICAAATAMDEETQDALEGFINFAFPDDIPDEWSAADRRLSHGDGFVVPGTTPSRANWIRTWFPDKAQAAPKEFSSIRQIIENSSLSGYYIDEWLVVSANQFSKTL